jgi:hypothetical protein
VSLASSAISRGGGRSTWATTTPRRKRRYRQATRSGASQGEVVRRVIPRIIDDLLIRFERQFDRFAKFQDRHHDYKGRAEQGLAVVLIVGVLAALGALTAVALTSESSGVSYLPPSSTSSVSVTGPNTPKAVTEGVVRRPASKHNVVVKTVARRGRTVKGLLRLPGQTVRDVLTLTTEQVATVTDVQPVTVTAPPVTVTSQPVTVTVVETITCKKKC